MLAEFAVFPLDKGDSNLSEYVAKITRIIRESGLDSQLTAMGTLVEGETEEVFELIKKCHLEMTRYSDRIYTKIAIDDRKGSTGRLKGKVQSVEDKLRQGNPV